MSITTETTRTRTRSVELSFTFRVLDENAGTVLEIADMPQGYIGANEGPDFYFSASDGIKAIDVIDAGVIRALGLPNDATVDQTPTSGAWIASWDSQAMARLDGKTARIRFSQTEELIDGEWEWVDDASELISLS